ncbi:MAG TPA: CPBP family intramembrane glutamic endopeptidase [Candidatus Limnocylindrales bacterium]|jgi:hypothetical protein|nr:CPBP family intramembrane glutamic endopeptidase [Candidatus Limnocylindrales bacterium]
MEQLVRDLIFYAFVGLLVVLRFDARRFMAAEHDDENVSGGLGLWLRRLSWYALGLLIVVIVYNIYPLPISVLHLQLGDDQAQSLLGGLALAGIGTLAVVGYAYIRYGRLRYPPPGRYPAGLLSSIGTAIIDEAAWRGILLGLLIAAQWPIEYAVTFQALLYGLATRMARPRVPMGMLVLVLAQGFLGGWLTVETGGIGAALLGHALTRLAFFVATGHGGPREVPDEEDFRDEREDELPVGLEVVHDADSGGGQRLLP